MSILEWLKRTIGKFKDYRETPSFNFDPPSPTPVEIEPDINITRPGEPPVRVYESRGKQEEHNG